MNFRKKGDKLVVIPIELYQREMYTRLYLALTLVESGYDVLICDRLNPILHDINGGVVFYKDHAIWSEKYLEKFKNQGMKLVLHDAEGLIILDENRYLNSRVSKKVIDMADAILCWGHNQLNLFDKKSGHEKFHLSGDPRFDIARKLISNDTKKNKIKNILINTRFTYVNPKGKQDIVPSFKKLGYIQNQQDEDNFRELINNDQNIFSEFLSLIEIARNSDFNIIIRPHPSEDHDFYHKYIDTNIKVDAHTPINEQIEWADCVIHDGCTTALEARAQNKIVLGLRPKLKGHVYDSYANKFSFENFHSSNELIEWVTKFELGNIDLVSELDVSEDIYNFSNKNPLFSDVLKSTLDSIVINEYTIKSRANKQYIKEKIRKISIIMSEVFPYIKGNGFIVSSKRYDSHFRKLDHKKVRNMCDEIINKYIENGVGYDINYVNDKAFVLSSQTPESK
ncbi:surface carbohydrate biosynthesis protein [Vibrio splendidus]|jgi:surface carbohydrate biosynthesis protein